MKKLRVFLMLIGVMILVSSCGTTEVVVSTGKESEKQEASEPPKGESSKEENEEPTNTTSPEPQESEDIDSVNYVSVPIGSGKYLVDVPDTWYVDDSAEDNTAFYPSGNPEDIECFFVEYYEFDKGISEESVLAALQEDAENYLEDVDVLNYSTDTNGGGMNSVVLQKYDVDFSDDGPGMVSFEDFLSVADEDGYFWFTHRWDTNEGMHFEDEYNNIFLDSISANPEYVSTKASIEETTFPETVIYEGNGVTVRAIGFSKGAYENNVKLEITNTSTMDISWTVNDFVINDITVLCAVVYDVPAGKTAMAEFPISEEELDRYGIEEIHTLVIHSTMTKSDTYETLDYSLSERIITNLGEEFEPVLPFDQYNEVYSSDSLNILYTGIIEGAESYDSFETKAILFAYNDTDSVISVGPTDVSFDDIMDYSNYTVFPVGPHSYGEFYVTCENDDINNKNEIAFTVNVSEGDTYESQYQTPEIIVNLKQ